MRPCFDEVVDLHELGVEVVVLGVEHVVPRNTIPLVAVEQLFVGRLRLGEDDPLVLVNMLQSGHVPLIGLGEAVTQRQLDSAYFIALTGIVCPCLPDSALIPVVEREL